MQRRLIYLAQLIGISSMSAQIVLMRETLIVFYGNELSVSVLLGMWLVWTALGSGVMSRFADRIRRPEHWLILWQLLVANVFPLSIIIIREWRNVFGVLPGEMLSLEQMLFSTFLLLAPLCLLLGSQFVLTCRTFVHLGQAPQTSVGRVYIYESLGASLAGLAMSVALIQWLSIWQIAGLLWLLNLTGVWLTLLFVVKPSHRRLLRGAALILLFGSALGWFKVAPILERLTLQRQWRGVQLVTSRNSVYGNITVAHLDRQYSFFENGLLMFTTEDPLAAEEASHLAMLQHPAPERVLLIGGGPGGTLEEILKHPVRQIDYVELDPLVIRLAEQYLPEAYLRWKGRVNLHHLDARLWVQQAPEATYDVVLLNLPEPFTAQLARFYSVEFFREVKRVLRPGGVFAFSISSSENYLSLEQRMLLCSLEKTLRQVFPVLVVLPGNRNHLIAQKTSPQESTLSRDPQVLVQRLQERQVQTQFVSPFYLPFRFNPLRLRMLDAARQDPPPGTRANHDLRPIAYFYDMLLWLSQFEQRTVRRLQLDALIRLRPVHVVLVMLPLLGLAGWRQRRNRLSGVTFSIGTTGFSEIVFEIVVILAFQVLYGYVYYKLSLILAAFMMGLVGGAWCIQRALPRVRRAFRLYRWVQLAIGLYPLVLLVVIALLHRTASSIPTWFPVETLFALLPALAGFLGGVQFPLASHLRLEYRDQVGAAAGGLYGVDLFGSCVGAILASLVFVPIFGILITCWLAAVLNLGVWLVLFVPSRHD